MKPFYWSVFRFLRKGNLVSLDSTALSNSECLPSNTLSAQPHKCSKQIATLLRIAVVNRHALRNIWMQHIATLFKAQRVEHVGSTCCKALDRVMGMLSEQVTTTYNTHEINYLFKKYLTTFQNSPSLRPKQKKMLMPGARKMATSNIICLFAKYLWRAKDKTESTSINIS